MAAVIAESPQARSRESAHRRRGIADEPEPIWRRVHEQLSLRGRIASSPDLALVELRGTVDADSGTALARVFDELVTGGVTSLSVDAAAIASVESAGARVFACTANKLEALGGRFRVHNAPSSVEELFWRNGLGRLLIATDRTIKTLAKS